MSITLPRQRTQRTKESNFKVDSNSKKLKNKMLCASPSFVTFVFEKFHRWRSTERVLIFPCACAALVSVAFCTAACYIANLCKAIPDESIIITLERKKRGRTKNIYKPNQWFFNHLNIFDRRYQFLFYFKGIKYSLKRENHSFNRPFIPSIFFLIEGGKFHSL